MKDSKAPFLGSPSAVSSAAAAVLTCILVFADQITKILAVRSLSSGPYVLIPGVFEFRYLENHGMAFSLLQNQMAFFYIGTVVFFAAAVFFWFRLPSGKKMRPLRILIIFLLAGGIGNFIDRVRFQYVRDFLYFSLIDFPIFNVADMYVTVAAIVLVVLILFYYKDEDFNGIFPGKKKE
ncbi:MAG: signal peptidase II [Lachnospiraceae bacterium]|nr:signal peptidase II [Lachnospiraceae bacterium]